MPRRAFPLRLLRLALCCLAFALAGTPARAEDDADTEVARRLFKEGRDLYGRGDYEKALAAFEKARTAKPLPAFDYNIARCHDRLGRWTEALAAYVRFVASTPDDAEAKEAQGRIQVLRERVRTAGAQASAEQHYKAAITAYNLDRWNAAITEFKLAHEAVADPLYVYSIAQAYRASSDAKNAILWYRAFLRDAPASPLRPTVEKRIADLESKPAAPALVPGPGKRPDPKPSGDAPGSVRLEPIADVIKTNRAGFRACFDDWSRTHPGIGGRVVFSFYLDPDGVITQASAESKGIDAPDLGTCIVTFARTLRYPPAPNARFTRFNYPFDFKPN